MVESGAPFFAAGVMAGAAQLLGAPISRRIGLGGTMLVGHVPASLLLILAALAPTFGIAAACLIPRGFLSQLDVPTRPAFVAARSPRGTRCRNKLNPMPFSLAAAVAPSPAGWLLLSSSTIGWHMVAAGIFRLVYAALFLTILGKG